jgi:hypothetical protein
MKATPVERIPKTLLSIFASENEERGERRIADVSCCIFRIKNRLPESQAIRIAGVWGALQNINFIADCKVRNRRFAMAIASGAGTVAYNKAAGRCQ